MNSKDYRNIREAYLQVYAHQELTEEQVWEEVEYWVNSLLEEGYDLSDYTWEEMYEGYITELMADRPKYDPRFNVPQPKSSSNPVSDFLNAPNVRQNATNAARTGMYGRYGTPSAQVKVAPVPNFDTDQKARARYGLTPKKSTTPTPATPAAPTPARPAASATSSGPKSTPTTPTTPTKPVASTTPTSTAPTKPAIGTTPGGTKFERRTPTSAELSAAQDARAAGKGEEGAIKAGVEASKPATPAPNPVKADVPGFALGGKPPTSTDSGESDKLKIKKSDVTSGFDMFDVVKGYLIGEGYADTEEAALAIMANMSEDWKYSIMEQQISSVSANAPSGVKKPTVTASISAGGKTPPGQKMLDKAGQMLSGKGPSNNFGRGF